MRSPPSRPIQNITITIFVVGILALALGGYLSPITSAALKPFIDIQNWVSVRFILFQDLFTGPSDLSRLHQENAELEGELAALQTEIIALQQQVTEVEVLSALLGFVRAQPESQFEAASVIGRDPSPFLKYVIINRGSDDDIRRGMPVVAAQGLIGRVAAVTAKAARVQMITDPASSVNIRLEPSGEDAVLLGSITGELSLDLIPQETEAAVGDLVQTSGLGGNYPPNILIGQINTIRKEATALFQTASVQPIVDFNRLEIVLIIINFRPIDITPLIPEDQPIQ